MFDDSKTILLVEDNPDDEFLTLHAFRENHIPNRIDVVRDGAEALDYLFGSGKYSGRDINANPAVILLDLNLPKVSGLGVLQRMRADARTRLLPVVVLTTSVEQKDVIQSYELGCNSYTRKPVDLNNFIKAVHELGLYWLTINVPPPQLD